ncbi:MAG: HAMP domain-containing sensor histidine kinase [Eubacteriales bacterium]|nr:HAMP domain-containing sensor histidine kinase [Eubacteriales bacterium]
MKKSLYFKFIFGYLIFAFAGFLMIATVSSRLTYRFQVRQNAAKLYDEAVLMADTYTSSFNSISDIEETVSAQLRLVARFLDADIWVMDDDGLIVLDSSSRHTGTVIEGFSPADSPDTYTIGNYYGTFPEDMLSVNSPITQGYRTTGYIVIHLPMQRVLAYTDGFLNIVYITGAVLFLLSLIFLILFHRAVYRPLKKITQGAMEYADGNLDYHIDIDNVQDEMGYLANTLNYMSSELFKLEDYQKSFIANVSHDFRSPLTSIKGYLEAILDGTIPPEMHEKYLHRVISETERLNKLTEGMLTLNSLDSKGFLRRSNFDINRTIKEICAANEVICEQKGISFELTFAEETEMVYADYGKIQQVLYNLIDNAIKFSDPDSTIFIRTTLRQKKVFVSVKDTGCGIPKESIKKIWDRFFKSDTSRGKDKKGTGLGLSIVKEIIQAHGENIDVISTEKVGTEFIFSLPTAKEE